MKRILSLVVSVIISVAVLTSCGGSPKVLASSNTERAERIEKTAEVQLDTDNTAGQSGEAETAQSPAVTAAAAPSERGAGVFSAADETGFTKIYSNTGRISPDMPDWTFNLYGQDKTEYGYNVMVLGIFGENGQRLYLGDVPDIVGNLSEAHVILADANFDGYKDVWYTEGPAGAHGHILYSLLLWDNGNSALLPSDSFKDILNPVADAKAKVIRSLAADSAFEEYYGIYRWADGEFIIDRQLILTYGEVNGKETRTLKTFQYINGVPQPLSVFSTSEPPDPRHPDQEAFYGEDSIWKLDDPIWYDSAHFKGMPCNAPPADGFYSGVLLEGRFYHDGRDEWLTYYYADVGKAQYDLLNGELGGVEDYGQSVETEIQLYATDDGIRLKDHIGQRIMFKGEFFEANTIYHRRNIVFGIKELGSEED